jgi:hypothetical protein
MTTNRLNKALKAWRETHNTTCGEPYFTMVAELEAAIEAEPTAEPEPRFKVGDRVEFCGTDYSGKITHSHTGTRHDTAGAGGLSGHFWEGDESVRLIEPIPTPDIDALARARDAASELYREAVRALEAAIAAETLEAAIAAEKGE